jgi:hypothetical protein
MNGDSLKLFKEAVHKHGAVDARTGLFNQGDMALPGTGTSTPVFHCFNKEGKEVCLFIPGVSKTPRVFKPPRTWVPSLRKRLRIIATKEEICP